MHRARWIVVLLAIPTFLVLSACVDKRQTMDDQEAVALADVRAINIVQQQYKNTYESTPLHSRSWAHPRAAARLVHRLQRCYRGTSPPARLTVICSRLLPRRLIPTRSALIPRSFDQQAADHS